MSPDHMDDPFLDSEDEQGGGQGAAGVSSPAGPAGGAQQLPLALGPHLKGAHHLFAGEKTHQKV